MARTRPTAVPLAEDESYRKEAEKSLGRDLPELDPTARGGVLGRAMGKAELFINTGTTNRGVFYQQKVEDLISDRRSATETHGLPTDHPRVLDLDRHIVAYHNAYKALPSKEYQGAQSHPRSAHVHQLAEMVSRIQGHRENTAGIAGHGPPVPVEHRANHLLRSVGFSDEEIEGIKEFAAKRDAEDSMDRWRKDMEKQQREQG